MSPSEAHAKRVAKLTQRVRAYADAEGIGPATASYIILNDGKELARLEGSGSTKPLTLEKFEYVMKRMEADTKAGVTTKRDGRARRYAAEFKKASEAQTESAA